MVVVRGAWWKGRSGTLSCGGRCVAVFLCCLWLVAWMDGPGLDFLSALVKRGGDVFCIRSQTGVRRSALYPILVTYYHLLSVFEKALGRHVR